MGVLGVSFAPWGPLPAAHRSGGRMHLLYTLIVVLACAAVGVAVAALFDVGFLLAFGIALAAAVAAGVIALLSDRPPQPPRRRR
jgi:hypothetical protein